MFQNNQAHEQNIHGVSVERLFLPTFREVAMQSCMIAYCSRSSGSVKLYIFSTASLPLEQ